MKIYFSQIPDHDIDSFGDDEVLGPNQHGDYFYNQVEFGTNAGGVDEVAISDTCGRYVPICVDSIPDLVRALLQCYNMKSIMDCGDNIKAIAESDVDGHVEYNEVEFDRESVQAIIESTKY